jgi:predicted DNA binding CopG/RHH family protein
MKKEYDFSQSIKNPYTKKLKKQITIRIENETIDYFKNLAIEIDIPYQKLINMFLKDCAVNNKKPSVSWNAHKV